MVTKPQADAVPSPGSGARSCLNQAMGPDLLASQIPSKADKDRPWLVWYGPGGERVELTGHVAAMWVCKAAGLLEEQTWPGSAVHVGGATHWRTVLWCAGAWWAGREVVLGRAGTVTRAVDAGVVEVGLSVALVPDDLAQAELQVLLPGSPLALRWDGGGGEVRELPPLVLDGVADVMAYPDYCPPAAAQGRAPALTGRADAGAGPGAGPGPLAGSGAGPGDAPPRAVTRLDRATLAQGPSGDRERVPLTRTGPLDQALPLVLGAWRQRRAAVLVSPQAGEDVLAAARRQELVG